VSGIDTRDPQHVVVQVSDPGTGEALASYPMEQFLEAWHASDFFMVATQAPAPAHLPEMTHFDYSVGHIADVAGLPYDQFLGYANHPGEYEGAVHQFVETHHDADGLHLLHDPALPDHHGEPVGLDDAADVHHDPLMNPHHSGTTLGHLDATDHPLDDHWRHDGS
jgi:hypothetical protein